MTKRRVTSAAIATAANETAARPSPTQQRILDSAVTAFTEQGFAGTSTREIAQRAGVAEGTIFRYFPTKNDLLVGAAGPLMTQAMSAGARERIIALFGNDYPSADMFIRAVAADRLAFARENPTLIRLVVQEMPFHPALRARFQSTVLAVIYPPLLDALRRMQERGLMAEAPLAQLARIVISLVIGFVLPRVFLPDATVWDDEAELDLMARVFASGIARSRLGMIGAT